MPSVYRDPQIAANTAAIAAITIGQSQLRTTQGQLRDLGNANGLDTVDVLLAGGEYCFLPQVGVQDNDSTGSTLVQLYRNDYAGSGGSVSRALWIRYTGDFTDDTGGDIDYRYVTASPPYDIGDGEVPLFVFGQISGGKVRNVWIAEDPPWAHNGPTIITPDVEINGKKYRAQNKSENFKKLRKLEKIKRKDTPTAEDVAESRQLRSDIMGGLVEIDNAWKNQDMGLIPHPYRAPGSAAEIFMLDPPETEGLLEIYKTHSDDIGQMIRRGNISVGDEVVRSTPNGVRARKWSIV